MEIAMTSAAAPAPAQAKASVWEDFLDIFYAPSQVFARRMDGKFGLALVVLVIASAALAYAAMQALEPAFTGEIDRQMAQAAAQNPNVTPEQLEGMRSFGSAMMLGYAIIGVPIMVMLTGLVLWLVGKLFDSQQTVGQALMVATYANFPRVLGGLLMTLQGLVMDTSHMDRLSKVTFSAARFAPDGTSEGLLAILTRVEVFTIWVTVLLAIGLHITGRVNKGNAYLAAFIVFVVGSIPAVLQALR